MNNPNLELITDAVNSGNGEEILSLLNQFLESNNLVSCRELIVQLMVKEDLDDIFYQQDRYFVTNILRGKDWTGYNHLSFTEVIEDFNQREIILDTVLGINSEQAHQLISRLSSLTTI